MSGWTRRRLLGALSSLPLAALTRCSGASLKPLHLSSPGGLNPLTDAHCHLFNVTDLPAARFAQIVFIKD